MRKDWKVKKLGDLLMIERGGSPRPIQKYLTNSEDGYNWIKIADATASDRYIFKTAEKITKEGLHKTRLVKEGDFLLSNSMSFGRPYIMKTTGCIHDGWLVLRQNGTKYFETEFLYYLLSSPFVFNQFNNLASGSTVRNLNIALVSSVTVPIPPLPDQKRIVSILDKAFAAIDHAKANAEQNLNNAKELFESYLKTVFDKKGKDWKESKLGDIAYVKSGGTPLRSTKEYWQGDIAWYSSGELNDLYTITPERHINDLAIQNSNAKLFPKGSLLIGMYDTAALKMSITDREATFNQAIAGVKPNEKLDLIFILYSINSIKPALLNLRRGVRQKNLSLQKIQTIPISLPPLEVQKQIVKQINTMLEETKKLEKIFCKKLEDLEELKKSILHKAFNGEL
jgi:type I restriction enzyme S subunit